MHIFRLTASKLSDECVHYEKRDQENTEIKREKTSKVFSCIIIYLILLDCASCWLLQMCFIILQETSDWWDDFEEKAKEHITSVARRQVSLQVFSSFINASVKKCACVSIEDWDTWSDSNGSSSKHLP
jgi:hypothetical protein